MSVVRLEYDAGSTWGRLLKAPGLSESVWLRIRTAARSLTDDARLSESQIDLPWPALLVLVHQFASQQAVLGFRFESSEAARPLIQRFLQDVRLVGSAKARVSPAVAIDQLDERLEAVGWDASKRQLTLAQKRNVSHLTGLSHGANFSVPGAGKTTVTLALHLLCARPDTHLLVVAPKNAFAAWRDVLAECLRDEAFASPELRFVDLVGGSASIEAALARGGKRFLITYDQLIRCEPMIGGWLARNPVHLVLDEAHRMKAGYQSQRGTSLLNLAHLAVRRDVLTGTPMPQSPRDIESQLDFLWPGVGLGTRISLGEPPRQVLGNLYVRTTKADLGLPPRTRHIVPVQMSPAHLAFYAIVKDDFRRRASEFTRRNTADIVAARRSVMRLLQIAANPLLATDAIWGLESVPNLPQVVQAVVQEGPSQRLLAAVRLAREFAAQGRKTIIWTIFTATIDSLAVMSADLSPVTIYGQVPTGEAEDEDTREGRIKRFKNDPGCMLLIANPAAASEGISLHMHCHDAIYLDRSYNATHFLQSIDRIHRLGLPPETKTNIWVLENQLPPGLGSIDFSVRRRLGKKIREMYRLLEDPDLHALALDEESYPLTADEAIDLQDIDDLIEELEGRGLPPEEMDE